MHGSHCHSVTHHHTLPPYRYLESWHALMKCAHHLALGVTRECTILYTATCTLRLCRQHVRLSTSTLRHEVMRWHTPLKPCGQPTGGLPRGKRIGMRTITGRAHNTAIHKRKVDSANKPVKMQNHTLHNTTHTTPPYRSPAPAPRPAR